MGTSLRLTEQVHSVKMELARQNQSTGNARCPALGQKRLNQATVCNLQNYKQ